MPRQAKRPGAAGAAEAEKRSAAREPDARERAEPESEGESPTGRHALHHRGDASRETPASAAEALAHAREHARAAASEAIAALRALLDAVSLGASGKPCEAHAGMATLAKSLDEVSASLAGETDVRSSAMVEAILDALDEEIRRWEVRSVGDVEARAVLRAFLGVREILWEFGLCRSDADRAESPGGGSTEARHPSRERRGKQGDKSRERTGPKPPARAPRRVQRVKVQS